MKLRCKICGKEHENTSEKFPIVLLAEKIIYEGKGENKKPVGKRKEPIGYICKWCLNKRNKQEFIQQHNIKAAPGERIRDAIVKKSDELKLAQTRRVIKIKPKKVGIFKKITSKIFNRRRGGRT